MGKIEWKFISGYEGLYEVSTTGEVRSVDRYVNDRWGNKQFRKGKVLKQNLQNVKGVGYLYVGLWKDGRNRQKLVHRLVAEAFVPNHYSKGYVNHRDFNKENNHVTNLEWCTAKENIEHFHRGVEDGKIKRSTRSDRRFVSWNPKDKSWVGYVWNSKLSKQVFVKQSKDKELVYTEVYNYYLSIYGVPPWELTLDL